MSSQVARPIETEDTYIGVLPSMKSSSYTQ